MSLDIKIVDSDEAPPTDATSVTGDYDPEFPGSTEEAPYGYFPDGRIRKRRPKGHGKPSPVASGSRRSPASESQARTAAGLLARMNGLLAMSLGFSGLPTTAESIAESNAQFESMAYEALLTDPALCRKILSAGATSGKTGLIMAYGMLAVSIAPTAFVEIKERRHDLG